MKNLVIIVAILLLPLVGASSASNTRIKIGSDIFSFPASRLAYKRDHGTDSVQKYDTYSPIILRWSANEIRAEIPNFVESVEGVVYPFNIFIYPDYRGNLENRLESYKLIGQFSSAKYSYDSGLQAYKVSRNLERQRWDILSVEPRSLTAEPKKVESFWLADCSRPVLRNHLFCTLETIYRGHYIEFSTIGENIKFRGQLVRFINQYLDSRIVK